MADSILNLPSYSGDVSGLMGKQLLSGDQNSLNSAFGYDPARSNYDFQNGGNIYTVSNNNNGTRSVSLTGSVASRLAQQQSDALAAQNAAQEGKINDFYNNYNGVVAGLPKLTDVADSYGQSIGLPQAQSAATTAMNTVANLPQTESTATRGYNVNSNQLSQIIASKLATLSPQAQQYQTAAEKLQGDVNNRLTLTQQQNTQALLPIQAQGSMLSSQIAAEMTGFNNQQSNDLQVYLNQINNGEKLSEAQLNNANALAIAKIQYDNTAQKVQGLMSVSPGDSIFNPSTGQFVGQAPNKPGTGTGSTNVLGYLTPTGGGGGVAVTK